MAIWRYSSQAKSRATAAERANTASASAGHQADLAAHQLEAAAASATTAQSATEHTAAAAAEASGRSALEARDAHGSHDTAAASNEAALGQAATAGEGADDASALRENAAQLTTVAREQAAVAASAAVDADSHLAASARHTAGSIAAASASNADSRRAEQTAREAAHQFERAERAAAEGGRTIETTSHGAQIAQSQSGYAESATQRAQNSAVASDFTAQLAHSYTAMAIDAEAHASGYAQSAFSDRETAAIGTSHAAQAVTSAHPASGVATDLSDSARRSSEAASTAATGAGQYSRQIQAEHVHATSQVHLAEHHPLSSGRAAEHGLGHAHLARHAADQARHEHAMTESRLQEVRDLRARVQTLADRTGTLLRSGEGVRTEVYDTQQAAEQATGAAHSAQTEVRDLLSGCERSEAYASHASASSEVHATDAAHWAAQAQSYV